MPRPGYREIFIFIAGATPQVITETICALAMEVPPVYPDRVYVITTNKGRTAVEDALVSRGVLKKLSDEYGLPCVSIGEESFIIPADSLGVPLDDIRDDRENELMGDLITAFIREKTADSSARLHCSIAGGRKTMSFYLGAAMQLFGRPWDKLYHVLVSPEFESTPEFYYKPKQDRTIDVNGRRLNTADAEITLAELPFIRLRNKLSLDGSGFRELVREGQKDIDIAMVQPELRIRLSDGSVKVGWKTIRLAPMHLMIYVAYLRQKLNRCRYPDRPYCYDCTDCFPSLLEMATKPALEEMARDYFVICPSRGEDLLHRYKDGLPLEVIRQAISKIKRAITGQLGDETLTSCYSITTSLRKYSNSRHGVRVEKSRIRIE